MLRFLRIQHLAVIDSVEVEFDAGLNVLTGETGAGKSILVEAVGLLLGGRASGDLVRTGEDGAAIEAIFESGGEELLVRREITAQGRSRAFVNGALVTAGALKDLSSRLIELHGQHEHQTLLVAATHLDVIDSFGALDQLLTATEGAYNAMRASHDELARLRTLASDRDARQDLITFQLGELDRAALKEPSEDADLAALRQVLASAERVERLCAESYAALYERDDAILAALGGVWRRVGELASLDPTFQPYVDARDGIKSQLEDLAGFLRKYADSVDASPARLQQVEERLAVLERLKRKHGPSLADVVARRDGLRRELADLAGGDDRIAEMAREAAQSRRLFLEAAERLSRERQRVAASFARNLEALLGDLAMERTQFEVRFAGPLAEPAWSARGVDAAEFFVSPNPGEELRPLARVVSGGELSRIMLAIKTLSATSRHGFSDAADRPPGAAAPGLIFDEVDAGIGGRVADVVGRKLRALGSAFQVLCITHLPQIAAYADTHFEIEKRVDRGRTRTSVRRLDESGRVEELARMLGGEAISDGLRASAREMLVGRKVRDVGPGQPPQAKAKGESEAGLRLGRDARLRTDPDAPTTRGRRGKH
ncbi:MAG TPA: DNA repair protein RecN [Vicinamibacterales bacterium]|nr:DNA repair protein RecN [Vicinamibacterales bacterium]